GPGTGSTRYFGYDGHGSTRLLIDRQGAVTRGHFEYDAFGGAVGFDPSTTGTTLLYAGERWDSRLGKYHLRARSYDPATGRFDRLDSFEGFLPDPATLHKYV